MYKCLLHVDFRAGHNDGQQGFARLDVELPFCPTTDVELEQPPWSDPRAPVRISYNLERGDFYLIMPTEEATTVDSAKIRKDTYALEGWTVS